MRGVWVSLIVGITVLAAVFYVYSTSVTVNVMRVFIQYSGSGSNFLASNQDLNTVPFHPVYGASNYTYSGFAVNGIKQVTVTLSLISDSTSDHKVISIQARTVGFTILQIRPAAPITILAQTQALNINLLLQCPFLGYTGDFEIVVVVT